MGTRNRKQLNQIDRKLLICFRRHTLWLLSIILITLVCSIEASSQPYYLPYSDVQQLYSKRYHQESSDQQSIVSSYNILSSSKLRNSQHQLTKQQTNFTHLVLDSQTDQLYIGATNFLLKFDSNLRLVHKQRTGPVDDSPQCSPNDCFSVDSKEIKPTNNFNKILLLDSAQRQLILCGSVKQGACYQLPLDDELNSGDQKNSPDHLNEANLIRIPVGANDENSSSVAFIGPANYVNERSRVMYVAVTNTKLGQYRELVPSLSARSLNINNQDTFRIIESSFTDSARVDISSHLRDYYLVHYVYGFHYHDHIYFAQVQKRSHLRTQEEFGYHTRLSRICDSDANMQSYTEITLECIVQGETRTVNYNALRAATLAKIGSNLADGLGLRLTSAHNSISGSNEVLIGVFSLSKDHSTRQGDHSAVCAFSMNDIERRFKENIHLCYNGSIASRNMDYIAGSINECPKPGKAGNILNFCEETVKLNGSIPLHGVPLFKIDGTELTAIVVNTAQNLLHTVAFLGTRNGKLLKTLLKPEISESRVFEIVNVDSEPILGDLLFDSKQKHIYVATSKKVAKVLIERCPEQSNCTECLNLSNPYCGWCSLEKKCSRKSDCITRSDYNSIQDTRTAFSTPRWLPMDSAQCINFEKITPNFIPIDKRQNVHLTIHQLPILPYGSSYSCVFNDKIITPASLVSNGLTCPTPELSERPIIDSSDHVTMRLAVKASTSDTTFIQRTFAFYDCNVHKTCRSCVSSEFACTWCKMDNSCATNQSSCDTRMAIFSEHSLNANYNAEKGSKYCPSFKVDNEIIIPHGVSKEISLKVQNLNNDQNGFQCMMEIEGAREIVKATVLNGQLVCLKNMYTYLAEVAQYRAQLTILRNGDTFIDRTNVTLYKCELMGSHNGKSDCSLCQSSASRFQCAFCSGRCSFKEECGIEDITICPPPRIDLVYPLSGPIEGGTILTIEGSNLGSSIDQLRNKISIGSATCEPIQVIASVRVVCKTQAPDQQDQQSSKVVVANSAGLTFSQEKFHFKKIELKQVSPNIGPQSGGTQLYLSGENFNIGSNVQVYLDEIKCDVDKQVLSSKQLTCRTRPSNKPRPINKLTLIVDNANLTIYKPFLYTENPTIKRITPVQSYLSGGRILNVLGERFLSIQTPKMGVYYRKQLINETYCTIVNNTLMFCPTPSVKEFTRNFRLINGGLSNGLATFDNNQIDDLDFLSTNNNQPIKPSDDNQINNLRTTEPKKTMLKLKISFGLDNSLRSLPLLGEQTASALIEQNKQDNYQATASKSNNLDQDDQQDDEEEQKNFFTISYVSDPKVYKLDQTASSFNGHSLVIQGENLNYAISTNELNVTIAGAPCSLTSLTENQVVCSAIIDRSLYRRKFFKDKSSDTNLLLSSLLSISPSRYEEQSIKQLPVVVRFSENLEFHLGHLTNEDSMYFRKLNHKKDDSLDDSAGGNEEFFSREQNEGIGQKIFIKGAAISGLLLIVFCSILLISFRRKSNEVEKQYKQMQVLMMNSLENSVRLECKQAFVELQTDLTEVSNNISQDYNVALLSSIKYISNMFFPGLEVNPLSPDYKHHGQLFYNNATNGQLLEELLFHKHFLLTFIDVLEQQPSFTLRDRVNVASLLMITLIEKMDYAFCILEELLLKSIANYAKSKYPQLLLRRTEFIVEKMLVNFLAITMEKSLSEESGNKLFLLCNAIKSQVEIGPIDYYTHEARYTLAEERLLKQQIEFNVINLIVFKLHSNLNEKSEYQVKVLDCDCISQVKTKILDVVYKNLPKSKRPELSNVILEHNYILNQTYSLKRNGTTTGGQLLQTTKQPIYGQSIILEDDDDTTQTDSCNWRAINTVKHYQLMNNSIVTMRVLNELYSDSLNDQSQFNYTIYDNYTDSGTGHLYECIGQETRPSSTLNQLIKNRQYFDQQSLNASKHSSQNLPDMLDLPISEQEMNRKNLSSIYGYSTASTIMSNRLLKQVQQQQMPLLGTSTTTTNGKKATKLVSSSYNVYYTLSNKKPFSSMRNDSQLINSNDTVKYYHLSKDLDQLDTNSGCSTSSTLKKQTIKNRTDELTQNKKLIKEIYLTRLLTTKGTLQRYIDDFFSSVLVCNSNTPIVVKWLFDLLDDAVQLHGINDPEIVYAWKCNSLPLRFWVNLLKNPNFLFDLEKTPVLDCNLNVIAQAFLDSCSLDLQVLNKESHSAKLLFARDIPRYREMVRKYYDDIRSLPKIRKDQMLSELKNCSKKFIDQVDRSNALNELLVYTTRYKEVLLNAFYNDSSSYYSNQLQIVLESIYSKS